MRGYLEFFNRERRQDILGILVMLKSFPEKSAEALSDVICWAAFFIAGRKYLLSVALSLEKSKL